MSRASEIIKFLIGQDTSAITLPSGISLINPYTPGHPALSIADLFYQKYYADNEKRLLILGINPGRFGAGMTGIPFTDPKRLLSECGIAYNGKITHEPSSAFIYDMIAEFGGVEKFYNSFYINSLFPLTVVKNGPGGKVKNYNYYDDPKLLASLKPFIIENIHRQSAIAGRIDTCICLGTGRNADVLRQLNDQHHFFDSILPIEHPRFIVQYKSKERQVYLRKYIEILDGVL